MTKKEVEKVTELFNSILQAIDGHGKAETMLKEGFQATLGKKVQEISQFISQNEIEIQEKENEQVLENKKQEKTKESGK